MAQRLVIDTVIGYKRMSNSVQMRGIVDQKMYHLCTVTMSI